MTAKSIAVILALAGPLPGAYQYYYSDPLTSINPTNWTVNGIITATSAGLASTDYYGGSLISRIPVPDGTANYEIATRLNLTASGGSFAHYYRATPGAKAGIPAAGGYYAAELSPSVSETSCVASLRLWKRDASGAVWLLASTQAPCRNGMVMRSIRLADRLQICIDGARRIRQE